jgi:pimeloyl-ACP methyl ester carboxylesterase
MASDLSAKRLELIHTLVPNVSNIAVLWDSSNPGIREMLRRGWYDPAFMRAHSSVFMPGASVEQVKWLSDLMQAATSGEVAARVRSAYDEIAIVDLLPKVKTPTIVFHCRDDSFVPFEQGRLIASSIPNAKFVTLESGNHALLPDEPAWAKFVGDMEDFLASGWG